MPKVRRKNVPRAAIEHLALRVRERAVPIEDLQNLAKWLDTNPTVPSGRWGTPPSDAIIGTTYKSPNSIGYCV
jgi:hypothetical protein